MSSSAAPEAPQDQNLLTPYIKSLLLEPPNLTPSDLSVVLKLIIQGYSNDCQVSSFLTALKIRKLDQQPQYISAAARTMLEFSHLLPLLVLPQDDSLRYLDIVGTGGDGKNTFNVSTSSAIIAAGIQNLKVVKHGGKASSSSVGSGDLIAQLGINVSNINLNSLPDLINDPSINFIFLFAPIFHPIMKNLVDLRKNLNIPTIFNILGPLINPFPKITSRIIGVNNEALGPIFANTCNLIDRSLDNNNTNTMIVYGEIGLDEISPQGKTKIWLTNSSSSSNPTENDNRNADSSNNPTGSNIICKTISPADFGLKEHSIDNVKSGTPEENARFLIDLLNNRVPLDTNLPLVDYILMNTAALCVVAGVADDWKKGVELAKTSILSGNALASLTSLAHSTNAF
ncbi:anthranilate phosphoribosyltransferase ASCRUDRAFT_74674 [Ascoidea rubescens DSM 1968]|uniref:Anthranilate phosphoribosyltransferase n=1 Tax=Ascoidea rubescens DSM 1968 TaxID=1344418 RepID=A0A1D2VKW6_9ASCO|nr:hypothetical protein ASCRUDRAFT_74674 [Ascoidea rubescens DSM 1968]ODV62250.1 hypothetical protein ASCRUDRAFT_74674 [Ascoidea rubescens DSM 1968]